METRYSSKYMTISVDTVMRYIKTKKHIFTESQSDANYKTETLKWSEIMQAEKPIFQLVDERDMRYLVVPELQRWINEVLIQPAIKLGLRRVAFLIANDIFVQTAVKQMMKVLTNSPLQIKYFDDEEEAKKWLFVNELESKMTL